MKNKKIIFILGSVFLLSSCGSTKSVNIPNVNVSCDSATDCMDTSADGKPVLMALFKELCAVIESSTTVTPFKTGASTIDCTGGPCVATVSSWNEGETSTAATMISAGTYGLASFIDTGGNVDEPDSGEPFVCKDVTISDDTALDLTSGWVDFP